MKPLTPEEAAAWPKAILEYDRVMAENVRVRTTRMSESDRRNYYLKHNTKTDAMADILAHMTHWGGFRGFLMSGGVTSPLHGLFARLLSEKPALEYPPPRTYGDPWYDLFEVEQPFICEVQFVGESQRDRDEGKRIFLLTLNECPWECVSSSPAGAKLIELAQLAQSQSEPNPQFIWGAMVPLLSQPISYVVRYGQWDCQFALNLISVEGRDLPALATAEQAWFDKTVFMAPKTLPDFPFQWQLTRL